MKENIHEFVSSWSGGKDSCFAFMKAIEMTMKPKVLLNMMNENGQISRSHGIPQHILERQASALNLPIVTVPTTWNEYEVKFINSLKQIVKEYSTSIALFGDIDLQAHKEWEEKVCRAADIEALLPLWQKNRKTLVYEMIEAGIEAYIVSCNEVLGEAFLGKLIDQSLIESLESLGVDVCGENGEYHTLVVNCPYFKHAIEVNFGKKQKHHSYWFIEMK